MKIHKRNLQVLTTDIFKVKNGIAPELMSNVFQVVKKPYDLRDPSILRKSAKEQKRCKMPVRLFLIS